MALTADTKQLYIPLTTIYGSKGPDGQYSLSALDVKNLNDNLWNIVKKIQGNISLSDLQSLTVDELRSGTVISNTVITQNLYSVFGDIAELTVDRLITTDKVERYKNSDTTEINYVWIEGKSIKLMTGTTDGSTTQHTDRNGALLYWYAAEQLAMGTTATAFPVMAYYYEEFCKAELSFIMNDSTGYHEPMIVMGAGDGLQANSGKAYIRKGSNGLELTYYKTGDSAKRQLLLTDDGVETNPPILIFPDAYNATAVSAAAATVLEGIDVQFQPKTRVAFDVQIDVTSDQAMSVLLEARVAGAVHRHATKYFSGAYKDTFCFNGVFDAVPVGMKTVDMVITPSAGTASIAIKDYRLMLTIRNGSSQEADPWPEIGVTDYIKVRPNISDKVTVSLITDIVVDISDSIGILGLDDSADITLTP